MDESLLDETECPLVVDAKITPMAFLHLIDARCRAGTHTSTLPLASGRAELDSTRHCVTGACPPMGACPIRIHLVPFTCFVSWATTVVPAVSVLPTHRHEQRAQWRRSALCR